MFDHHSTSIHTKLHLKWQHFINVATIITYLTIAPPSFIVEDIEYYLHCPIQIYIKSEILRFLRISLIEYEQKSSNVNHIEANKAIIRLHLCYSGSVIVKKLQELLQKHI